MKVTCDTSFSQIHLLKAIDFVRQNTLVQVIIDNVAESDLKAMWPGISLRGGNLMVDLKRAHLGDFLHEVGHLTTIPHLDVRQLAWGNLQENEQFMLKLHDKCLESSDLPRYYQASDDDAATFWAYMACRTLRLDTRLPFVNGYGSDGPDIFTELSLAFCKNTYSRFSTQAYYAGLLETMLSKQLKTWDLALLN